MSPYFLYVVKVGKAGKPSLGRLILPYNKNEAEAAFLFFVSLFSTFFLGCHFLDLTSSLQENRSLYKMKL